MRLQVQILSFVSVLAAAYGMCFGAPSLQRPVVCPETMVYYPQLCICIEPKRKARLHDDIGYMREAPNLLVRDVAYPINPEQAYKRNLAALRHRLTASLPDTSIYSNGNSVFNRIAASPSLLRPDYFHTNQLQSVQDVASMTNHVPRSWKIGGLYEYWRRRNVETHPTSRVMSKQVPASSIRGRNRRNLLPMIKRLNQIRAAWQRAALTQARNRFGNEALARRFLENLPRRGISPDTSRAVRHTGHDTTYYDSPRGDFFTKSSKKLRKGPLLALKEAALKKQGFGGARRDISLL